MILPDFVLPSKRHQCWQYSGMDSEERCLIAEHFKSYPFPVLYEYNSRGFRDQEWPTSIQKLRHSIWCLGDSFTVGLGSPRSHTWSHVLQERTGTRTINVSMDGASNNWIARKAVRILQEVAPSAMVLHWSYLGRREMNIESALDQKWNNFYNNIRDPGWPDCERTKSDQLPQHIRDEIDNMHGGWNDRDVPDDHRHMQYIRCTDQEDVDNTLACIHTVNEFVAQCRIIHSFIPKFEPEKLKGTISSQISGLVVPEFEVQDLARDGHHYDLLTSQAFVDQLVPLLK